MPLSRPEKALLTRKPGTLSAALPCTRRPWLSCLPLLTSCALKKPVRKNRTPIPMTVIISQYDLVDLVEGG